MIGGRLVSLFVLVAVTSGGFASAAQPRRFSTIQASSVKLSDLFIGLDPGQDCDIGPAPAPGARIVIEQPQLAAIAEQFGVEWQPGTISVEVSIERRARFISREEVLPLIRSALIAAGAPESIDIGLTTYARMAIPAELTAAPEVQSLNFNQSSGRFTADLAFDMPGMDPARLQVAGIAQEMIEVPVLKQNLGVGSIVTADDLQVRRLRKGLVGERTLMSAEEGVGLALRHRWMAGSPIPVDELTRPLLVTRAMPVLLRLEDTGLLLTARGEAIEGGALGDRIHVLNPASRAVLVARVTGPGTVQVDTSSTPVLLSTQQSGLPPIYSVSSITSAGQPGSLQ